MKRGRRLFTAMPLLQLQARLYGGEVIPPRSLVRLLTNWPPDRGRIFRIGYYSQQDGLNCVWLVNDTGEYEQTTDQRSIRKDFELLHRSEDADFYGDHRQPLGPINIQDYPALQASQQ